MPNSQRKSKKQIQASRKKTQQTKQRTHTLVIVGIVALLALAYVLYPRTEGAEVNAARLDDNPSLGSAEAAVVLTEFGDFTCSAC